MNRSTRASTAERNSPLPPERPPRELGEELEPAVIAAIFTGLTGVVAVCVALVVIAARG
jgi:hypothetical protein